MTTQNSISTSSSSIVHPCNLCSEQFDSADKLARHKWRKYVNAVQVIHEGITIVYSKTENEYVCPIDKCNRTYKSANGFPSHLNAAHNASLSTVSKLTGDDNQSEDEELSLPSLNMIKQWSHLGETHAIDNEMFEPTILNYEEAILSAPDALHADAKVKKNEKSC